jgi:ABC-type nitrate/sulfonate/bicarbonate transport system permease component
MLRKVFYSTGLVALLLILWQLLAAGGNNYIYPSPLDVLLAAFSVFAGWEVFEDSVASLSRLGIGFVIGLSAAVLPGLAVARLSAVERFAGNTLNFLRFIPPLALVPLTILWFGIGEPSKYFIIAWTVFFPVYISIMFGAKSVNKRLIWVAQSLGAAEKQVFKRVILPATAPFIATGARVGIGIAFSVIIASEMVGAFSGLGYRIWFYHSVFRVDLMFVYIILLGAFGLLADWLVCYSAKRFFFWGSKDEV